MTGAPAQPLMVGVMVIVPVMGVLPVLVAVNAGIFPVPDAARPMAGFELVHVKLTPDGETEMLFTGMMEPSFTVVSDWNDIAEATGVTVTSSVAVAIAH